MIFVSHSTVSNLSAHNSYHLESETGTGGRLVLSHVVRKGATQATHYGLSLAALTPLPQSIIQRANHLATVMTPRAQVSTCVRELTEHDYTFSYL